MEFNSTMYEPNRMEYSPNLTIDLKDTPCKSSSFAICSGKVKIDVNDFRAIPDWKYDMSVVRGQLIGCISPT